MTDPFNISFGHIRFMVTMIQGGAHLFISSTMTLFQKYFVAMKYRREYIFFYFERMSNLRKGSTCICNITFTTTPSISQMQTTTVLSVNMVQFTAMNSIQEIRSLQHVHILIQTFPFQHPYGVSGCLLEPGSSSQTVQLRYTRSNSNPLF